MVGRKQALADTPGTGIGNKRAEEHILEPGAYGEIPGLPCRTHPPCTCPRCPCQEWIPQRRCGITSGAAKAPLALGSLRSSRSSWFVFGMRRHRSKGRAPLFESLTPGCFVFHSGWGWSRIGNAVGWNPKERECSACVDLQFRFIPPCSFALTWRFRRRRSQRLLPRYRQSGRMSSGRS